MMVELYIIPIHITSHVEFAVLINIEKAKNEQDSVNLNVKLKMVILNFYYDVELQDEFQK